MPRARELLAIPARSSTWQRYAFLVIGAALVAPYGTLAGFVAPALEGGLGQTAARGLAIALCGLALPIATGMLPAVRELEIGAARRLLGVEIGDPQTLEAKASWPTRWRSAAWFVAHLVVGGVIGTLTVVLPPAVVSACLAPFESGAVQLGQLDATVPGGPGSAWIVPLAVLSPLALVFLAVAAGALLGRIEATRRLLANVDDPPRVLVLTTFENDDYVFDALRAGASGFLLKRARPDEVIRAIRMLAAGDSLLFPAAIRDLAARHSPTEAPAGGLDGAGLTEREGEVLLLIAKGLTNAEIAAQLIVSLETVKTHVAHVLLKLDARDRTQAVIRAYQTGFITP